MGSMIFFDMGAWVALSVAGDRNASPAKSLYAEISRGVHGAIVTTNFVLDESATLIRMASDVETASRFLRTVLGAKGVTVVWIDPGHFAGAVDLFERHADKRWSFTDCTSFVVMRDLGITDAFTFDRNFGEAGFTRLP